MNYRKYGHVQPVGFFPNFGGPHAMYGPGGLQPRFPMAASVPYSHPPIQRPPMMQGPIPGGSTGSFNPMNLLSSLNMNNIQAFIEKMGGIDGILTKISRFYQTYEELKPMINVFAGLLSKQKNEDNDTLEDLESQKPKKRKRKSKPKSRKRRVQGKKKLKS